MGFLTCKRQKIFCLFCWLGGGGGWGGGQGAEDKMITSDVFAYCCLVFFGVVLGHVEDKIVSFVCLLVLSPTFSTQPNNDSKFRIFTFLCVYPETLH